MPDRWIEIREQEERKKYEEAMAIALSGAIARIRQLCAVKAGDLNQWTQIQGGLTVVGKLGTSMGGNSYVDQWEHSGEAWGLALYSLGGMLNTANASNWCCTVSAQELARQLAFLNYLRNNQPKYISTP